MNRVRTLHKALLSSIAMSAPQDRRRRVLLIILSMIIVGGIFIPVIFGMGFMVKLMTDAMGELDSVSSGLLVMLHIITIFTVVFGINIVFSELYFSHDIEFLLPLPLKAEDIVLAKFWTIVSTENVMQSILVISCIIGYGISTKMGVVNWLCSLIGVLTLPVVPFAYCAILCILIMGLTRLVHSKDVVMRISMGLVFVMMIVLVFSMNSMQNFDIEVFVREVAAGEQKFFRWMNWIFPNVYFFVRFMANADVLALVYYVLINGISLGVMLLCARLLYFKGVLDAGSRAPRRVIKDEGKVLAKVKELPVFWSLFLKEVRILMRTPVYFTNCVIVNFFWPVFVVAIYKLQRMNLGFEGIRVLYGNNVFTMRVYVLFGIFIISIIISAMSSIASGAISREGQYFQFMKYIPVSYKIQWHAKAMTGVFFSTLGMWIYLIPGFFLFSIPLAHCLCYLAISLASIVFISYMGIYLDSIQPKLVWDDELSSLRENYNTFYAMGIAILFAAIVTVVGVLFYRFSGKNFYLTVLCILLFIGLGITYIAIRTIRYGILNLAEQEET
ncbi:MAG: hypothetical protein K6C69_06410 [Lachnospiraceae bacterium]|nr:hypothetical protein [Lachnospiraceae bacterium]